VQSYTLITVIIVARIFASNCRLMAGVSRAGGSREI